jgi:hypothetical protein
MEYSFGKVEMDYASDVGGLPTEELIQFYEILAHSLTVSVRTIWSDEALTDAERVEQMKWLNEITHRVVRKSAALRKNRNEMSEADTWKMMEGYISQCPSLAPHIAAATISSYQAVAGFPGAAARE